MKQIIKWSALILAGALVTALLVFGTAHAQSPQPLPTPSRLVDQTGTLTEGQKEQLTQKLISYKDSAGTVIVVVMIVTTKPEDIFSYSQRLFDEWKIGVKGKDNGVLILVAKNDRKVRVHTGYGAEGPIPDAIAKRITDAMAAKFKQGDFFAGVNLGVDEVAKRMTVEKSTQAGSTVSKSNDSVWNLYLITFLVLMIIVVATMVLHRWKREKEEDERREARRRRELEEAEYARYEARRRSEEERLNQSRRALQSSRDNTHAATTAAVVTAAVVISDEERRRQRDESERRRQRDESERRQQEEDAKRRRRQEEEEAAERRRRDDEEESRRSSYSSSSDSSSSSSWSSSDSGGSSGGGGSDSSW